MLQHTLGGWVYRPAAHTAISCSGVLNLEIAPRQLWESCDPAYHQPVTQFAWNPVVYLGDGDGGINVGRVEGIPSLVYFWVYLLAVLL